ncbi:kinase-like domain-containing protein [Geopyxis carbonaria]|nr:kinase-like domain-containing protein [Geopyxis carbonaria]
MTSTFESWAAQPRRAITVPLARNERPRPAPPRIKLENSLFCNLQTENYAKKPFIPEEDLYKKLTKDVVFQWVEGFAEEFSNAACDSKSGSQSNQQSNEFMMRTKFTNKQCKEYIFKNLRKILSILILTGNEAVIYSFYELKKCDLSLPLEFSELELIKQRRPQLNFNISAFWRKQFEFTSFKLDFSICSKLQDEQVVPFKTKTFINAGYFSKVYKITVFKQYDCFRSRYPEYLAPEFDDEGNYSYACKEVGVEDFPEPLNNDELFALIDTPPNSEHVVPLLGAFIHNNVLHMIFPLIEFTLEEYMKRNAPPTDDNLAYFLKSASMMTEGLFAFQNPNQDEDNHSSVCCMHRDLSTQNTLVTGPSGPSGHVKFMISDFGLARFMSNKARTGYTPSIKWDTGHRGRYTAPECRPNADFKRSADVFSLGCLLLENTLFAVQNFQAVEKLRKDLSVPGEYPFGFHDGTKLKDPVAKCIEDLKATGATGFNRRVVLPDYLSIVTKMLNPNPSGRLSIQDCRDQFRDLFRDVGFPQTSAMQLRRRKPIGSPVSAIETIPTNPPRQSTSEKSYLSETPESTPQSPTKQSRKWSLANNFHFRKTSSPRKFSNQPSSKISGEMPSEIVFENLLGQTEDRRPMFRIHVLDMMKIQSLQCLLD